jgi:hypothetical protein
MSTVQVLNNNRPTILASELESEDRSLVLRGSPEKELVR